MAVRERTLRSWFFRIAKHLFIWTVLFFAFVPIAVMLNISLKDNQQFYSHPFALTFPLHLTNWATAWDIVGKYIFNTATVAISSTLLTLIFALSGAYFFARVRVPGSGVLWFLLVFLMMLPSIANLVPLFILLRDLNLLNTLWALVLVGCSTGQAAAIFVMRGYIEDIPEELFEAAEADGANHWWQFRSIVLPLSGPIAATIAVTHFIGQWNDFILPLVVLRDASIWTITVGLMRLDGEYVKFWGQIMAGYALASLPMIVLFLLAMRLFIRGLTEGSVKG